MKRIILSLLTFAIFLGVSSCKKPYDKELSGELNYASTLGFVINPNEGSSDSLTSIVPLEQMEFIAKIDAERSEKIGEAEDGYYIADINYDYIKAVQLQLTEQYANADHPSIGTYMEKATFEIYHGLYQDTKVLGTCETVDEIDLSTDQFNFDLNEEDLVNYINTHPQYKFRVVIKFHTKPEHNRFYQYLFDVAYCVLYTYEKG